MKIKEIAKICGSQDGAIWGKYLFRFNDRGYGRVYDLENLNGERYENGELKEVSEIYLDGREGIVPHCNAVVFGNEYYNENDEFPFNVCKYL